MKVLEFAFDAGTDCAYLPHNYQENSIVYTGTHDNETLIGWIRGMGEYPKSFSENYLNMAGQSEQEKVWSFIRLAMGSVSKRAVIPIQDYLCLGNEARMNHPSTLGANWKWRLLPGQIDEELIEKIRSITQIYGRGRQ
jgi:4-alpha-glucanotransferase